MNDQYGFVRVPKGQLKPFRDFRQIRRGRRKGQFEVRLFSGFPKKVVVHEDEIQRFPVGGR